MLPLLKLPVDFPGSPIRDFAGQSEYFTVSPRETTLMRELIARNKGVTLYMVLLSVYNILLGKYSGQETILVGAVFAGRPHGDLQNIIGMFTNMLVMRNVPSEHKSAGEFLAEVKENALAAYNNKDYPYEELVRRLNLRSQTMEDPLNAAAFGLVDSRGVGIEPTAAGPPSLPTNAEYNDETLEITPFQVKSERTNFMLDLLAVEQRNRIEMRFSYSTWRFKPSTVRTMTRHYLEILRQVLESPGTRIKDLKISHELSSASSAVGKEEPGDFDFN